MLALELPAGSGLDENGSHLASDNALDMIVPVNHNKVPEAHGPKHCVSALDGEGLLDCDCTAVDVGSQVDGFCKDRVVASRQPIHRTPLQVQLSGVVKSYNIYCTTAAVTVHR